MQKLDSQQCLDLLLYIADEIESQKDYLTELDSAIGDGDLGVSMTLGFRAIREAATDMTDHTISGILKKSGLAFSNKAPSTIGALFATGFLRAATAIEGKEEVGSAEIILMGEAAVEGIQQRGKAKPGDKTLLDALIPALDAAREQRGSDLGEVLRCIVDAADKGVESTKEMKSAQGRARWLQDRSIGHIDPGAAAVSLIFKSCVVWIEATNNSENLK